MYTVILRFFLPSNQEKYELVQTDSVDDMFETNNHLTRPALAALLASDAFSIYSIDELMECEMVRSFLSYSVKTFNFKKENEV